VSIYNTGGVESNEVNLHILAYSTPSGVDWSN